jgi:hypothetical protein
LDKECNCSKGDIDYALWLDQEEQKRLDAFAHNERLVEQSDTTATQAALF